MKTETYTSPSGNRYEIQPQTHTRMAGGVLEGCEMYEVEYVEYEIYLDNRKVQFALSKDTIADAVANYENPGPDLGSYLD
jgi:hypothetical protein